MDPKVRFFELTMWPHMRAAYNLARWLVRNDQDAEDVVQESFLKAFKAQASFRGTEAKTWMLSIVRNTAMDFRRRDKSGIAVPLGEEGYEPNDDARMAHARLPVRPGPAAPRTTRRGGAYASPRGWPGPIA